MEYEKCRDILFEQLDLVRRIGALQDRVYREAVGQDWAGIEEHFAVLDGYGRELAAVEERREKAFPDDGGRGFYFLAARLAEPGRRELSDLYRKLKLEMLRVKAGGEALTGFIAASRAALTALFQAAFPSGPGKTYSPQGTQASGDLRSMVVNQSF